MKEERWREHLRSNVGVGMRKERLNSSALREGEEKKD
jgi:hypothetical protein